MRIGLTTSIATAIAVGVLIAGGGGSASCALPNYPDATCTGVPAGTTLTTMGGFDATTNGQVITGVDVTGCINVYAYGVTIKNSKVECIYIVLGSDADNLANPPLIVQDVEIDCQQGYTGIRYENFEAYRVNIHNCENGLAMSTKAVLQDSYIHDLYECPTCHMDGIESAVGNNLTIRHNRILNPHPQTSAIGINDDPQSPTIHDTTIANNLLAGGGWTMYCPTTTTNNFNITDNAFSTLYYPTVGSFGAETGCGDTETFTGNFYYESGAPL